MKFALCAIVVRCASSLEMYALYDVSGQGGGGLGVFEIDIHNASVGTMIASSRIKDAATGGNSPLPLFGLACGLENDNFFTYDYHGKSLEKLLVNQTSNSFVATLHEPKTTLTDHRLYAAALDPTDKNKLYVTTYSGSGFGGNYFYMIDIADYSSPVETLLGKFPLRIYDIAFAVEPDGSRTLYGVNNAQIYKIDEGQCYCEEGCVESSIYPQCCPCPIERVGTLYYAGNTRAIAIEGGSLYALSWSSWTKLRVYPIPTNGARTNPLIGFHGWTKALQGYEVAGIGSPHGGAICSTSTSSWSGNNLWSILDPAAAPGGITETFSGTDIGKENGVYRTYSIPYHSTMPSIQLRPEVAYLRMSDSSTPTAGEDFPGPNGRALGSCAVASDRRTIYCYGETNVGSGGAEKTGLRLRLVSPEGVFFHSPDASSPVPYFNVKDLTSAESEFIVQEEVFHRSENGTSFPAREWFEEHGPSSATYDAKVMLEFYFKSDVAPIPCPETYPISFECVNVAGHYFALDTYLKTRHDHRFFGASNGFSLVVPGENDSEKNSFAVSALNDLLRDSPMGTGVWFGGIYNTVNSSWEYPDGTAMNYNGSPIGNGYCVFYDGDIGFEWANDSCDRFFMALFEVPPTSFVQFSASCCEAPTLSLVEGGGTVSLALSSPIVSSEQSHSFSVEDADSDPANEIQVLTATVNGADHVFLNLSNPFNASSPSFVAFSISDSDSDTENEIQDLRFSRDYSSKVNYILTDPRGNQTGSFSIEDADADSQNEIQDIALNGSSISIDRGSSLDLSFLNSLSLPFYIAIGENARKNVFGHPFGATSFAAPYNLTYVRYSVLVSEPLPEYCSLFVGIALGIYSDDLVVPAGNTVSVGDAPGPPGLNITSGEVIGISSVTVGGDGNCNSMNSETAMVLLVFQVVGY